MLRKLKLKLMLVSFTIIMLITVLNSSAAVIDEGGNLERCRSYANTVYNFAYVGSGGNHLVALYYADQTFYDCIDYYSTLAE